MKDSQESQRQLEHILHTPRSVGFTSMVHLSQIVPTIAVAEECGVMIRPTKKGGPKTERKKSGEQGQKWHVWVDARQSMKWYLLLLLNR